MNLPDCQIFNCFCDNVDKILITFVDTSVKTIFDLNRVIRTNDSVLRISFSSISVNKASHKIRLALFSDETILDQLKSWCTTQLSFNLFTKLYGEPIWSISTYPMRINSQRTGHYSSISVHRYLNEKVWFWTE